jgi:NAD(P)-dependent dehydrogenase (short-subunit alcohol dehydrogenase family)
MILKGKNALITGAGRGIGRGLALEFARQGATVLVADIGCSVEGIGRDRSTSEAVVEQIRSSGGAAIPFVNDVADPESVREMITAAESAVGHIDILINNAAIIRPRWSWELPEEDFVAVVSVHLLGQFYCLSGVLPGMIERNYGRIVNMASQGYLGNPLQISYAAGKGGVVGMTYAAAMEMDLIGVDVTVNAYAPHALTRLGTKAMSMTAAELEAAPIPDAPFIAFLASAEAGRLNGHVFGRSASGGLAVYATRLRELFDGGGTDETLMHGSAWTPEKVAAATEAADLGRLTVWPEWLNREQAAHYVEQRTGSRPPTAEGPSMAG